MANFRWSASMKSTMGFEDRTEPSSRQVSACFLRKLQVLSFRSARGSLAAGLFYLLLAVGIMLPLFKSGYLLALDLSWTPNIPLPSSTNYYFVIFFVLHYLLYLLPSQLTEKLLLLGILWVAGYGMHRLITARSRVDPWAAYFGGILFVINPFAYGRFLAGQYLILFGYALMPWFIFALWNFLDCPNMRSSQRLVFWTLVVSIVDLHSIFFMAFFVLVSLLFLIAGRKIVVKQIFIWGLLSVVEWTLLSSYWLFPLVAGTSSTASLIQNINLQFVKAFQTVGDPKFGVLFNAMSMYGFWVDKTGHYILPKTLVFFWPEIACVFLVLVLVGIVVSWRDAHAWVVLVVGVISLVLGVGIAFPPFAGFYLWMFYHVPFFKGDREPEKFIGMVVLCYGYLGACGGSAIANSAKRKLGANAGTFSNVVISVVVLSLPFVYNPLEMWGFSGQMVPAAYPADWYFVNQELVADHSNFQVLFLPWHMYLSFNFTHGIIYNPASSFFDKPTIQGNNIQIGSIYSGQNTPTSLFVENQILRDGPKVSDIGILLNHINVKYVILVKNFDVDRYLWLDKQADLTLINNTNNLFVFKNNVWIAH